MTGIDSGILQILPSELLHQLSDLPPSLYIYGLTSQGSALCALAGQPDPCRSTENPWIPTILQQDPCSIAYMEQPVADFVNNILMDEDESIEISSTRPLCIVDNGHDGALALYKAILKDFFDILADNNNITAINHRNSYSCTTSSSSSCVPADLQFRSLIAAGSNHIYGNSSTAMDSLGGHIQGEESSSHRSSIELGIRAENIISSGSLIASADDFDRVDHVLQQPAPSSTEACDPIHDLLQEPSPVTQQKRQCSGHGDVEARRTVWQQTPPHDGRTMATIVNEEAHNVMNIYTKAQKRDMYKKRADEYAAATLVSPTTATQPKKEERDFSFNEEMGEVIQAEYENLYVRARYEDRISDAEVMRRSAAGSKRKGSAAAGYYDLEELLMSCAQAVSMSDNKTAMAIVEKIKRQGASRKGGTCLHRMAFQFCRALEARLHGNGRSLYASEMAEIINLPAATYTRAWIRTFEKLHYTKIFYFFANHSFLAAACQAHVHRLHVVDYGISFGTQWAYLIKALSQRKGGNPPLLFVLTGVQFPKKARSAETTGRRLAEFAAALNVPFQFRAVASTSRWEDLDEQALGIDVQRRSNTAVVVNISMYLQFIRDETTVLQDQIHARSDLPQGFLHASCQPSPREKLLCRIRSLRPELVTVGVHNAGLNVPTFLTRFRNALQHFSSLLEMMEVTTEDFPERRLMERCFMNWILNVVACEGADRVVRPETYREWERRLQRAGLVQMPLPETVLRRSVEYVKGNYHRDCTVMVDNSSPWLLTGWRGRSYMAMSAWRPAC